VRDGGDRRLSPLVFLDAVSKTKETTMKKITVHLDKTINDKYKSVSIMTTAEFNWFMKGLMEQNKKTTIIK
jgi:hypothetical protein